MEYVNSNVTNPNAKMTSKSEVNLIPSFSDCSQSLLETFVPTYHMKFENINVQRSKGPIGQGVSQANDISLKTKKLRVKLICVLSKWKYMVAKTTVEDYHSLFGGVVDQIACKNNHFMSILTTLEKEFQEETCSTIKISFQKRRLSFQNNKSYVDKTEEEIPFIYIGTFYESDTIFTVIYIPKITNDVVELWNKQIRQAQETLLRKLFEGWKIDIEKIFEVNRVFHRKLMKIKTQYSYISKPVFNFICSRLTDYHHFLEKTGIEFSDENNFFDKKIVWEWNTMNAQMVKNKVKDLFEKTGVQVN